MPDEWSAKPGTFVYEPPGDTHTLVVDGAEELLTLFLLEGVIQYLDEEGRQVYEEAVRQLLRYMHYFQGRPKDVRRDRHSHAPSMPMPWGQRSNGSGNRTGTA